MTVAAVRADGFCAGPGCRNVRPEAAVKAGDAFCSRGCAVASFEAAKDAAAAPPKPVRLGPSEKITLAHITDGLETAPEIAAARGCNLTAISMHLKSLLDKGQIVRVRRGVYRPAASPEREPRGDDQVAPRAAQPPAEADVSQRPAESSAAAPAEGGGPTPSRSEDTDGFPDDTKDAYAVALIAAVRAFADTLEQELALR